MIFIFIQLQLLIQQHGCGGIVTHHYWQWEGYWQWERWRVMEEKMMRWWRGMTLSLSWESISPGWGGKSCIKILLWNPAETKKISGLLGGSFCRISMQDFDAGFLGSFSVIYRSFHQSCSKILQWNPEKNCKYDVEKQGLSFVCMILSAIHPCLWGCPQAKHQPHSFDPPHCCHHHCIIVKWLSSDLEYYPTSMKVSLSDQMMHHVYIIQAAALAS